MFYLGGGIPQNPGEVEHFIFFLLKLRISNTKNYLVLKIEYVIKAFTTRFFS